VVILITTNNRTIPTYAPACVSFIVLIVVVLVFVVIITFLPFAVVVFISANNLTSNTDATSSNWKQMSCFTPHCAATTAISIFGLCNYNSYY